MEAECGTNAGEPTLMLLPKPLDQIVTDDIRSLVENRVKEGDRIEYKESLPKANDDERIKFLCTVASLANSLGGDIVIGVGERREGNRKTGELFVKGLHEAGFDFDRERNRLTEMILKGIDPRVGRVGFRLIEGLEEGPVIVVRVPRSLNSPHMVVFNEFNRFFARHSSGRYAMNVREIRQAFLASELLPERIRSFRNERVTAIVNGDLPVPLTPEAKIILHVIPFSALDELARFDIPTAFELRNDLRTIGYTNKSGRYNMDGFVVYGGQAGTAPEYESYIQVFRNGVIEAVNSSVLGGHPSKQIPSTYYEQEIEGSLASILGFLRRLSIEPPLALLLTLTGVRGLTMALDPRRMAYRPHTIDRDLLLLPEVIIEEYEKSAQENLAPLFVMIWQAAGFDRNYNYDQQGQRLK
jgi:hypothetical protein